MTQSDALNGQWVVNGDCHRRQSSNGISMIFIPGQNVVLELNPIAGRVLEIMGEGVQSLQRLLATLAQEYQIDDQQAFEADVRQLFDRFVRHGVLLPHQIMVAEVVS